MRARARISHVCLAFVLVAGVLEAKDPPWREAGLTERQAAAHLLDRLTFGPRPGDIEWVLEMGLEGWVEAQLGSKLTEPELASRLRGLDSIGLPAEVAAERYPNPGIVLREALESGVISQNDLNAVQQGDAEGRNPAFRRQIISFAVEKGYRSQRELIGEAMTHKLLRAVYAENQLAELLTDFWFNHFNVSLTDNQCRGYVPAYEHDAIRPHVLGSFRDMLGATARHPAMLLYLDNAQSTADESAPTTMARQMNRRYPGMAAGGMRRYRERQQQRPNRSTGLNENYARELLELHTLGVDGGYTQEDVVEVARAFTGWAVVPPRAARAMADVRMERALVAGIGFEREGGFLFRADAHDEGKKTILGEKFPGGRGIEEGERVLDMLAAHPSTATHLARKLAVRFVADEPPERLVERLAVEFRRSRGDIGRVMKALVYSPEFWHSGARGQKIKSPFELTVSALRGLEANVDNPRATLDWIRRMGQPLYAYQAPTGYPDRAEFWVNTGSLLNRMNFGLELASGRVDGVRLDLGALNDHREPESLQEALAVYAALLMPERDLEETLDRLEPLVGDPELIERLGESAPVPELDLDGLLAELDLLAGEMPRGSGAQGRHDSVREYSEPTPLEQVVGIILGSPEFQRR